MKYFLILWSLALLISCQQEESIEGSWISTSSYMGNEEPSWILGQHIFEFDKGKLRIIQLGNHASGKVLEITDSFYDYSFDKNLGLLNWGPKGDSAACHLDDSLLLSFSYQDQNAISTVVFKRMDLSKTFTQKLQGSYKMIVPEGSTRVSFINDSIIINQANYADRWRIYNYQGTSLFINPQVWSPVAAIWDGQGDSIQLSYHLRPNRKVTLVKEPKVSIEQNLIGVWLKSKAFPKNRPAPPPPPGFNEGKFELRMAIDSDSLAINYYNGTKKEPWQLTDDGRKIYFPNKVLEKNGIWGLETDFENDSIVITRGTESRTWYKIESR